LKGSRPNLTLLFLSVRWFRPKAQSYEIFNAFRRAAGPDPGDAGIVNAWSYLGEAHIERKELKDFPQTVGAWQRTGNDQILDDETLKVLRASDYLLRDFRKPDGPGRESIRGLLRKPAFRRHLSQSAELLAGIGVDLE
jgi:hypothetical protein